MTDGNLELSQSGADADSISVPDVDGCLVLVVSHLGAAPLVEAVTTEAARRLMMSPMLADFIDLRYMHIGPQPGQGGDLAAVVARVTDHLIQPRPDVGRSFFAVVVMDHSAAAVEAVLTECEASLFLAALPIRLHGIASREDRPTPRPPRCVEIVVSPAGAWRREELIDQVRLHADSLFHDFAAGLQPGVTADQLARYREQFASHVERERTVKDRTRVPSGGFPAIPDTPPPGTSSPPAQDALDPGKLNPGAPGPDDAGPGTSGSLAPDSGVTGQDAARPLTAVTAWGQRDMAAAQGTTAPESSAGDILAARKAQATRPGRRASLSRRLMPEAQRWRAGADRTPRLPAVEQGLAYLLITGDESGGDLAGWNLSRAALLEIDKRLAAIPGRAMQVRVLQGDEEQLRGDLHSAGQLTKRAARGTVTDLYFAQILAEIRRMLDRDQARLAASALPLARPAVVLFAPAPPFAYSEAVECFRCLTQNASVIWVIPRTESDLLSEHFTEVSQVITDFTLVADDVAALFPAPSLPAAEYAVAEVPEAEVPVAEDADVGPDQVGPEATQPGTGYFDLKNSGDA